MLASAGKDGKVRLWDMSGKGGDRELEGGAQWVEKVAFSQDGRRLVSAAGKRIRMWRPGSAGGSDKGGADHPAGGTEGADPLWESADHASTVTDVRWRPGSSKELVCSSYGGLALYRPKSPEPMRRFEYKGSPLAIEWSPNGKYIAAGDQDSTVHFWIHESGADLQMFGYATKVRELAWDPTSRFLATGGGPAVTVWDVAGKGPEGTRPASLEAHEDAVTDLAFQKKGSLLASGGEDGIVVLWRPGTRDPVAAEALDSGIARLAWSPDDGRLAAGAEDGQVSVFTVS
jgi:WD40 repeat protein